MGLGYKNNINTAVTAVSNTFIDEYMGTASGEYVKVYLYLLRHAGKNVEIPDIAEALNHTEADVRRALAYWERALPRKHPSHKPRHSPLRLFLPRKARF